MTRALTKTERAEALAELSAASWAQTPDRDAVSKTFKFRNFAEAFGYMTSIAIWAEKLDHHPEWFNVYNRVDVVLTTHDINGLSALDLKLARKMDQLKGD